MKYFRNPLTGDVMQEMSYSPDDFNAVKSVIKNNFVKSYTVSVYDKLSGRTVEFDNTVDEALDDIIDVLYYISSKEHTFVNWIGVSSMTNCYVICMDFTRGYISFGSYHINTETKKLEKKQFICIQKRLTQKHQ